MVLKINFYSGDIKIVNLIRKLIYSEELRAIIHKETRLIEGKITSVELYAN